MAAPRLTPAGWQGLIVSELRGGDPLTAVIEPLWEAQAQHGAFPRLQYLWTKLAAIDWLIGNLDEEPTPLPVEGDGMPRYSTRLSALRFLRGQVAAEIKSRRRGRRAEMDLITRRVIRESPPGQADANDPDLTGNPDRGGMWR